ncbi:hypothetical protein BOX15_Mlig032248g1 [Macrostomum lignano]|uniref:RNA-directed DNA polymerase n=1 Tax=Macrostomum lignano TaxID=282301 RepID=A0A267F781_9PLAT|nr:hypothetical protein BOX15_Mlig032248g1 [Macrostomum lignano]
MSIKLRETLPLSNIDELRAWVEVFDAQARSKGVEDTDERRALTDAFMGCLGVAELIKVKQLVAPKTPSEMKWSEIKQCLLAFVEPKKKLQIAERTAFMSMRQAEGETVTSYAARLREQAVVCEFESLKKEGADPAEALIKMRLIAGLANSNIRNKVLEREVTQELTVDQVTEYVQQLLMVSNFSAGSQTAAHSTLVDSVVHQARSLSTAGLTTADEAHCHPDSSGSVNVNSVMRQKQNFGHQRCQRCGLRSHQKPADCRALRATCNQCGKPGHFARVCRGARTHFATPAEAVGTQLSPEDSYRDEPVFYCGEGKPAEFCTVKINHREVLMEKDSGASCSLISRRIWNELGRPPLKSAKSRMLAYDGHVMRQMGVLECLVETTGNIGRFKAAELPVIDCQQEFGLLGRNLLVLAPVHHASSDESAASNRYESLLGISGATGEIRLCAGARPIFQAARELPLALKHLVKKELDLMESAGIVEKVMSSEWGSPIVVTVKSDRASVRICGDYSAVNRLVQDQTFLTPSIETAFSKMANKKLFCRLDLSDAYYQVPLDEESKAVTTINTPFGCYRFNRLPYGIKVSPSVFQRVMEKLLGDHPCVIVYQDDVLIGAASRAELQKIREQVLNKLKAANVKINEAKCVMEANSLKFLGHIIDDEGIKPDPGMVKRVMDVEVPKTKKDLERFLGLAQFYGRLVPNFSEKCRPLQELRRGDRVFEWNAVAEAAFSEVKRSLASNPCIKPFDVSAPVCLRVDASEKSLGAVLVQSGHPVMFMSRALTQAETNYSNIEREALAIVWAVERARKMLLGKKFILQTDHEPLKFILNPCKNLPKTVSARLTRWALRLSAYDYEIEYVPGKKMQDADALSRLSFENLDPETESVHQTELITDGGLVTVEELRESTSRCSLLQRLQQRIRTGRWGQVSQLERPYKACREALSVENGLVIHGTRVVPPTILRRRILETAHDEVHPSAENTKAHVSKEFWWPGLDRDVRQFVERCQLCAERRPVVQRKIDIWPSESEPWSRVHMDHCEVPGVGLLLLLSDAYSGWPEAVQVPDRSAGSVLRVLRAVFARNGVPRTLVSDNAPEFRSERVSQWLNSVGCQEMHTPPYHPASNGQAERLVRSLKGGLKTWTKVVPFDQFLQKLLLTIRTSRPSGNRSSSPDILMWGRRLRHPLTMTEQVGDSIWLRARPGTAPVPAKFIVQHGRNTALVTSADLPDGGRRMAHANQWSCRPEAEADRRLTEAAGSEDQAGLSIQGAKAGSDSELREPEVTDCDSPLSSGDKTLQPHSSYDLRPRKPVCYKV